MEAQFKKGVLEMCVLFAIKDKETYGYDVMKTMRQYFPEVNESTFYAILRRLKTDGAAETTVSSDSNGPPRKYYKITENGRNILQSEIESWRKIKGIVDEIGI